MSSASSSQQIVRHKVDKHQFEVCCHPGAVMKWRKGEGSWNDVLMTEIIFKQFSKGERANAADLAYVYIY